MTGMHDIRGETWHACIRAHAHAQLVSHRNACISLQIHAHLPHHFLGVVQEVVRKVRVQQLLRRRYLRKLYRLQQEWNTQSEKEHKTQDASVLEQWFCGSV